MKTNLIALVTLLYPLILFGRETEQEWEVSRQQVITYVNDVNYLEGQMDKKDNATYKACMDLSPLAGQEAYCTKKLGTLAKIRARDAVRQQCQYLRRGTQERRDCTVEVMNNYVAPDLQVRR